MKLAAIRQVVALSALMVPVALLGSATTSINTSTQRESGFSNGQMTPFRQIPDPYNCNNYIKPFTKNGEPAIKSYWEEACYDGTRALRGIEAESDGFKPYSDGWFAYQFYIPTDFPRDKEFAIGQIFSKGGCNSWSAMIVVKNNSLILRRRRTNGCTSEIDQVIATDIQREAWKTIVMRFKVSRSNQGELKVWYATDEAHPTINLTGINFGDGDWAGDVLDSNPANWTNPDNHIKLKFGQYAFDTAGYTPNEVRVVYFDDVSMLKGNPSGAYNMVKP